MSEFCFAVGVELSSDPLPLPPAIGTLVFKNHLSDALVVKKEWSCKSCLKVKSCGHLNDLFLKLPQDAPPLSGRNIWSPG